MKNERGPLTKQLTEVEDKYPLVAMYAAVDENAEMLQQRFQEAQLAQQQRLTQLDVCLVRAATSGESSGQSYQAGVGCFDTYVNGDGRIPVDG